MKTFEEKLKSVLNNTPDNYLLPFLWLHNEDDSLIVKEIEKIYESGIRQLCMESRTHEEFGNADWWSDMELIFSECEKHEMGAWLLDDKHCPTGFANGKAKDPEYAHLAKKKISEIHTDVMGPVKNGALLINTRLCPGDKVLKIVAYKRKTGEEDLYNEYIDLTENYADGMIWFDLPDGAWKVFTVYMGAAQPDSHIDTLNPEAVDLLIQAVYEPMYEHCGKYFGNTFKGFFTDEPLIMRGAKLPGKGNTAFGGIMPYNQYVEEGLLNEWGADALLCIPSLFYNVEGLSPAFRVKYMDVVSMLYSKNFCWKLGDWSRAHGVEYIGHIIENNGKHDDLMSGAHFFRALDGQDMAGIDVVLDQILPGFSDHKLAVPCSYDASDNEFFHYTLAKLASSHCHIQPEKHGRAMCEMYGAFGWAEGLKLMKWLSDHMLVRGINYFVPHAFTPKYPDLDCPPHFYAGGHNPQFKAFRLLMEYSNRMSTLLSDGVHKCHAAVYYHCESVWAGGSYDDCGKPAKVLADNQIDYDIIPLDYLEKAEITKGAFKLNQESYRCLVVGESEILPIKALRKMKELSDAGIKVIFAGEMVNASCEGENIDFFKGENIVNVPYEHLAKYMRNCGFYDIELSVPHKNLRYYRYINGNSEIYMFFNEDAHNSCDTVITPEGFNTSSYIEYDVLENKAVRKEKSDGIPIRLAPYNSTVVILGEVGADIPEYTEKKIIDETTLPD
ncbi:MAG: glycosyl hydrolase, partial [Bacillota bacterium]|nr:glycosyl hydrolase [Bacillota bacterium]